MNNAITAPQARRLDHAFATALLDQMPALRSYARRLTAGAAGWEDLLQDTLVRCWAARDSFALGSNLVGWTRTVMRNCFLSERRVAGRGVDLPDDAIAELLRVGENQTAVVELGETVRAMGDLPAIQREAMILLVDGMSVADGATCLSITESTFKSRVRRGRAKLRWLLENRTAPTRPAGAAIVAPAALPRHPVAPRRKRRDWTGVMIG